MIIDMAVLEASFDDDFIVVLLSNIWYGQIK